MFAGIASVCNGAQRTGGAQRTICGDAGSRMGCRKVGEFVVVRSAARLGDRGMALADESQRSMPLPSNQPLQRTIPPQRHWCNINEPFVRRARR
jgi:hypothetical protein